MKVGAALLALAAAAALVPIPAALVERVYSAGMFPVLQPLLTSVSNRSAVAFFDVLVIAVSSAWLLLAVRDLLRRRKLGWLRSIARCAWRTARLGRRALPRVPGAVGLQLPPRPARRQASVTTRLAVTPDAARASRSRASTNSIACTTRHMPWAGWPPARSIARSPNRLRLASPREIGGTNPVVPARPKHHAVRLVFPPRGRRRHDRPLLSRDAGRERSAPVRAAVRRRARMGHLAGIADEGEANFVGWLTCVRGRRAAAVQRLAVSLFGGGRATLAARDRADAHRSGSRPDRVPT